MNIDERLHEDQCFIAGCITQTSYPASTSTKGKHRSFSVRQTQISLFIINPTPVLVSEYNETAR